MKFALCVSRLFTKKFSPKMSPLLAETLWQCWQNWYLPVQSNFWGNLFLKKSVFCRLWADFCRTFGEVFLQLVVHRSFLMYYFKNKSVIFKSFWILSGKISEFRQNIFRQDYVNWFLSLGGTVWGEKTVDIADSSSGFWLIGQKNRHFAKRSSNGSRNYSLRVQRFFSRKKYSFEKKSFETFRNFYNFFPNFCRMVFDMIVETAIYVSERTSWEKTFWGTLWIF